MKKLAVVGTFVAGAAVGFITCGVMTVRAAISSKKTREAIVGIVTDKVNEWLYQDRITYIPYNMTSECIFETREAAESVLNDMEELVTEYGYMSLQSFYNLCEMDIKSPSFEHIGWKNIEGARVARTRSGYEISMPETVELDA